MPAVRTVTVKMPDIYIHGIEQLVKSGRYSSRSEVIRIAVRELLKRELWSAGIPAEPVHLHVRPYNPLRAGLPGGVGEEGLAVP